MIKIHRFYRACYAVTLQNPLRRGESSRHPAPVHPIPLLPRLPHVKNPDPFAVLCSSVNHKTAPFLHQKLHHVSASFPESLIRGISAIRGQKSFSLPRPACAFSVRPI